MARFDHAMKQIAETTGRPLARIAGVECSGWAPLESTLPATVEKIADRAFRATQGDSSFIVYFEFYTTWDGAATWDILGKSGMLSQREQLPTVCIVVIFQPKGYKPQNGRIQLEAAGGITQFVRLREVPLWEEKPEPWWDDEPGLMALYPLCHHGEDPEAAIRHAPSAIEKTVVEQSVRQDFLAFLGFYSLLGYPTVNVLEIIGEENMRDSAFFQQVFAKGETEGELRARRADIIRVLRSRFKITQTVDLVSALGSIDDPERLDSLFDLALDCAGLGEFQKSLA
jgi:hypothetical protein